MKYLKSLPLLALGLFLFTTQASAQDESQTVSITVDAINEMAISANASITISAATAGIAMDSASDNGTTYDLTTNESGKIITAQLGGALVSGLTLEIQVNDPGTGLTAGLVALTDVEALTVVSGITPVASEGNSISYTATADVTVAPDTYSPIVNFTISNE